MRMLLLVLAVLLVAWLWMRRRGAGRAQAPAGASERRQLESDSAFHAVSIKTPVHACDAAKALEGKRFLASEAPRLPLPACPRESCECRFQHYRDRRSGQDRRSPFGSSGTASPTGSYEQERRHSEGRRTDDQ
jgi:hypothetical protein